MVAPPELDGAGRLLYDERWVPLSFTEERLAGPLVHRFGRIVRNTELIDVGWPGHPATLSNLRRRMSGLRTRLRALGLDVIGVRRIGYVLQPHSPNHAFASRLDGPHRVAT